MRQWVAEKFVDRFGYPPRVVSAPGRVNLIGEHTDYNDGFVLPFAISARTYVAIGPGVPGLIRAYTATFDKYSEFDVDEPSGDRARWTLYLRGMITVLRRRGILVKGADIVVDTEIPFGAGLSSSAAFEIAAGLAFTSAAGGEIDPRELAFAGREVENEFVGVRSGIMDQLASAMSRDGHLLLIDCRSYEIDHIPFGFEGVDLIVCDTKVKHSLASSEYNTRRAECEEGVRILTTKLQSISSLRDVSMKEIRDNGPSLPPIIERRCRHVVTENQRVLSAVDAVRNGDLAMLGALMYESHESLKNDYEVSCKELDLLVDTAKQVEGVIGSRMTGGGFGGCTISLVKSGSTPAFYETSKKAFSKAFGHEPGIFAVRPSAGAGEETLR